MHNCSSLSGSANGVARCVLRDPIDRKLCPSVEADHPEKCAVYAPAPARVTHTCTPWIGFTDYHAQWHMHVLHKAQNVSSGFGETENVTCIAQRHECLCSCWPATPHATSFAPCRTAPRSLVTILCHQPTALSVRSQTSSRNPAPSLVLCSSLVAPPNSEPCPVSLRKALLVERKSARGVTNRGRCRFETGPDAQMIK